MEETHRVPDDAPCAVNLTMFQGFEWHLPADHQHWARLARAIPDLATLGITSMWIPPAAKGMSPVSTGYDTYDLYDLGEFDQKGAKHTKYGTKDELARLVDAANGHGVGIIFDAILNHKAGADRSEVVSAVKAAPDRLKDISKPQRVEAWTAFDFAGRREKYSALKWNKDHFNGVDWDQRSKSNAIWRLDGKKWARDVDEGNGNYDFLMFSNIDHSHPEVRADLYRWVEWLGSQLKLGGLRLDAVRHFSASFLRDLMRHIDTSVGQDWFVVGEYWRGNVEVLSAYVEYMNYRLSLFDVPLVEGFYKVSTGAEPDIRRLFDDSLAAIKPANTVTIVTNHDTQPGQTMEMHVEPFFIPIAYAIILLCADFGLPCVFWGDIYGIRGPRRPQPPPQDGLMVPRLMLARKFWAYGTEMSYFSDSKTCIGFTRFGHPSRSGGAGLAVTANIGWRCDEKRMCVGRQHAGERWADVLGKAWGEVCIDDAGYGVFPVAPRGVSVWTNKAAENWDMVGAFIL
ncbi:alpha-amylase [Truncatella angustata]|uniref:Alpha-amylase n=1 Tax=Truncatella angustata TaxID=152316 RepID=A0A9P8UIW4_9PEZI|nr:alpha-amylase [Truncatella angustata]KAH6652880.1 alpha-amylase [Truncatella angustata]